MTENKNAQVQRNKIEKIYKTQRQADSSKLRLFIFTEPFLSKRTRIANVQTKS